MKPLLSFVILFSLVSSAVAEDFSMPRLTGDMAQKDRELAQNTITLPKDLESKGSLYHEPAMEAYLRGLISAEDLGLAPGPLPFRIWIVKDPNFNAFSTPAGDIFLNTGLLSRLTNTDQVCFVLAHEMMHLLGKDPVIKKRDAETKTFARNLFNLALIPVTAVVNKKLDYKYTSLVNFGSKLTSAGAETVYVAAVRGYGRELENRADLFGMELLRRKRRDPWQAVCFLEQWLTDDAKYGSATQTYFYSLHDSNRDRLENLKRYAADKGIAPSALAPDPLYGRLVAGVRKINAMVCMKTGWLWHAKDDLERVLAVNPADIKAMTLLGEDYTQLIKNWTLSQKELNPASWQALSSGGIEIQMRQWAAQAIRCFRTAMQISPNYADPHLGLSELYAALGNQAKAEEERKMYERLK